MSDRNPLEAFSVDDVAAAWIKMAADFWGAVGNISAAPDPAFPPPSGRTEEFWAASRKLWNASAKAMSEPGFADMLQRGLQTVPDISMRLAQKSFEGFLEFQKRWAEHMQKLGVPTEPYSFSDLDPEFLNRLTDIYKKEFQQFLEIPQVGLTRFYQERCSQALDKFNLFQAAMAEFVNLISVPIDKSYRMMLEKLAELTHKGQLPEEPKHYYQMWIKMLEGHYMNLFQSPQYTETMARTIEALNQFLSTRNRVLEDALKLFPICTHRDMDDISREVYQLKRRIRALEKRLGDEVGK
jgi:class III poly(R)-hydroxyalkanoic acid synthase PhaE subunit